jgi:hypothetical protein
MCSHRPIRHGKGFGRSSPQFYMDLGLLMSDQPVRHIEIYLLLARNNVCVSYSLVIFGVGLEHGRKKDRICDIDALVKKKRNLFQSRIRVYPA